MTRAAQGVAGLQQRRASTSASAARWRRTRSAERRRRLPGCGGPRPSTATTAHAGPDRPAAACPTVSRHLRRGPRHAARPHRPRPAATVPTDGTIWAPGPVPRVGDRHRASASPLVDQLGDVQLPGVCAAATASPARPATGPARAARSGAATRTRAGGCCPSALPARVGDLARELARRPTAEVDAAEAIASYLRTHATYRWTRRCRGAVEDAVDRFLFVDRRGFCEQFASARWCCCASLGDPGPAGHGPGVRRADAGRRSALPRQGPARLGRAVGARRGLGQLRPHRRRAARRQRGCPCPCGTVLRATSPVACAP